jgi:hypothetical protein
MRLDKEFEDKLKNCIEKYGKKPSLENDGNINNDINCVGKKKSKRSLWSKSSKKEKKNDNAHDLDLLGIRSPSVGLDDPYSEEPDDDPPDYYFNYKLTDMSNSYAFDPYTEGDEDFYKKRKNIDITIHFYDDDMIKACQDIIDQPEIYSSRPKLEVRMLFSCIHNFRIKYDTKAPHADLVKRVADFVEELFDEEITKMDKMIENNMIDYKSLWYCYDKIDSFYSIKHTESRICFKHESFTYTEVGLGQKVLRLNGNIVSYDDGKFHSSEYSHNIKKYDGLRNIGSFDIRFVTDEERENMVSYGTKMLEYAPTVSHMKLNGKQHVPARNSIATISKSERVMIDEEGMNKYGSKPYTFDTESIIEVENITDEHKLLMFPYVSIFNLGIRKMWGMAHIAYLEPVIYNEKAFDKLVIDPYKKMIIETLVKNHDTTNDIDIIEGKGKGLIFLLYGPPGVGKTLTSEAISEYMKRPLYSVNVSDLGTNPDVVEDEMEMIIDYARRWNGIIMIDEADIFVETREMSNIMRNAMVGTFLKFLEYNQNIMFLTTNRIRDIDPAVKSRMNLLLSYPDLKRDDRIHIWTNLTERNKIQISKDAIILLADKEMNGREIRNNVKILTSMLKDKDYDDDEIIDVVERCHALSHEFETCINMYA